VLMKGKERGRKNEGYRCAVRKVQVEWLALHAFRDVMGKRQSKFGKIIEWLDERIGGLRVREGEVVGRMGGIIGEVMSE
jgi:hypothetical protein